MKTRAMVKTTNASMGNARGTKSPTISLVHVIMDMRQRPSPPPSDVKLYRFKGRNCDQDIDECAFPDACFKGTCINTKGSFVCKCEPGFTGQLCNEMINECEPNPCKNGATCLDDIGRFICVCMPGKKISNMDIKIPKNF